MATLKDDFVSIITPAYNAGRYLTKTIESVQRQTYRNFEHIIVDDCSTDETSVLVDEAAKKYGNIIYLRQETNLGPVACRNLALSAAVGRYVAFLDADDLWLPRKLSAQISYMRRTSAPITFTDYRFMSEDGKSIGRVVRGFDRIGLFLHYATRSGLGCLTVILDRLKIGDFRFNPRDDQENKAEDFYAWIDILRQHGPAHRVPEDLARYRVVSGSRSSKALEKAGYIWRIYRKSLKMNLVVALFFFLSFAVSAFLKRTSSKPLFRAIEFSE